ncbi:hypothetical protein EEO80_19330 [Escherichia albertii]|nr:hypothetical protein [Escherichia albertii]
MQKKTLLSACIALALSGSGWAADIDDTDSATRLTLMIQIVQLVSVRRQGYPVRPLTPLKN